MVLEKQHSSSRLLVSVYLNMIENVISVSFHCVLMFISVSLLLQERYREQYEYHIKTNKELKEKLEVIKAERSAQEPEVKIVSNVL